VSRGDELVRREGLWKDKRMDRRLYISKEPRRGWGKEVRRLRRNRAGADREGVKGDESRERGEDGREGYETEE